MQTNFTRLLLLCLCLIPGSTIFSQVILNEGFESAVEPFPPAGWVVSHTGNANWKSLDGGNAYEGTKCMYLDGSYYGDQADAWLIGPSFTMTAGKRYSISLYYKNQITFRNSLEITLGDDTTAASQTEVIATSSTKSTSYIKVQINYTAPASGVKHLGIHCISTETWTYAYVDNVAVEEVTCFEPLNPTADLNSTTTTSATISWDKAGSKAFEWGISKSPTFFPVKTFSTTGHTANITGLEAATQYYFFVRSTCGEGEYSNWAIAGFSSAYDAAGFATLNCGETFDTSFHGNYGLYNVELCGSENYGKEFFHKFTPTASGYYKLNIMSVNDGQTGIFAYKEAAKGSGPGGWVCIGSSAEGLKYYFGPLVAGKEYYIQEKMERPVTLPTSYSYNIECYDAPPANDDCSNAVTIAATPYIQNCTGTALTTIGATPDKLAGGYKSCGNTDNLFDDDIWVKFTATSDAQIFRFTNMVYKDDFFKRPNTGLYFNIYSKPCDLRSFVDCGLINIPEGKPTEIYSYKLKKDSTYYVRMFTSNRTTYASFNLCIMDLGVTKGIANQCGQGLPFTINRDWGNKNTQTWIPLTDLRYRLIANLNANMNVLNEVGSSVYINNAAVRSVGGRYYLDRSITITPAQQAHKKLSVRLYFSNDELNRLITQPGSGVSSVDDINVTQNEDPCTSAFTGSFTNFLRPVARGDYGTDYKYVEIVTDHLSSFYLHGGNTPLSARTAKATSAVTSNIKANNTKAAVYPNPFSNAFTLTANAMQTDRYFISVLDMHGNVVKLINKTVEPGITQIKIEAANLAPGVYTLKIQKSTTVEYIKVVKQ